MEPVKDERQYKWSPERLAKRKATRVANKAADPPKMTNTEANKRFARMTSKSEIVSALMELDLGVLWVLAQLKTIGEDGGSNLQMSAVRQVMQLLSQGGLMTEANVTPKGRIKKETPPDDIIGDKDLTPSRIDEIVQQNMAPQGDGDASHRVHLAETA